MITTELTALIVGCFFFCNFLSTNSNNLENISVIVSPPMTFRVSGRTKQGFIPTAISDYTKTRNVFIYYFNFRIKMAG